MLAILYKATCPTIFLSSTSVLKPPDFATIFPALLQAATTDGSSVTNGTTYSLLSTTKFGTTLKGSEKVPITFSTILLAVSKSKTSLFFKTERYSSLKISACSITSKRSLIFFL